MSSNEWKEVNLGCLCDFNKASYSTNESWDYVNYLDTGNITENRIDSIQQIDLSKEKLPSRARRKVDKDDIVYSTVRPIQKHYGIIKNPLDNMLVSTGFSTITANKDIVSPQFVYYYLTQNQIIDELQAIAEQQVSTYPSIKASDIESLKIMLPSLSEQKTIADTLSCLDDMIELNDRINQVLEEIAQAIFKRWFVDFEFPNEDGQPYKSSGGEMVDSELGEIPKGWNAGLLSKLIVVKYGKDHKKLADGNIPVYGSGGIIRYVNKPLYSSESVLIPRKGTLNNVIYVNEPFWSVDTMFFSEMKADYLAKFIYFLLKSKDLNSMNTGSAVPSMTTNVLNSLPVIIPPVEVLKQYNQIVSPMFTQLKKAEKENNILLNLRDTLLPKLMSGEIRVPVEEVV